MNYGMSLLPLCCAMGACVCVWGGGGSMFAGAVFQLVPFVYVCSVSVSYSSPLFSETTC